MDFADFEMGFGGLAGDDAKIPATATAAVDDSDASALWDRSLDRSCTAMMGLC